MEMKNLTETRTSDINRMNMKPCGDYAGKFMYEAYNLLNEVTDIPDSSEIEDFESEWWMDIMFDKDQNVYAVFAEGALTSDSRAIYIELEQEDCPAAFEAMYSKI